MSQPSSFPKKGDTLQVQQGARAINVTVINAFAEAQEIVGRMAGIPHKSEDPRGSYIVASNQFGRWTFKHSLTPEQAGQPALTAAQKAAMRPLDAPSHPDAA